VLHELPLEPRFLHGHFSRDLEPVLTVEPGDTVLISTPNHAWQVEPDEEIVARNPEIDTGHALAGPIQVRGARAGQTLVVRIEEVRPSHWGVTHRARTTPSTGISVRGSDAHLTASST
jgi:acetamidase/formamidase